jgi:hypothetical protein
LACSLSRNKLIFIIHGNDIYFDETKEKNDDVPQQKKASGEASFYL